MSRANISYDMKQLSNLWLNSVTSKLCYLCKRCGSTFDERKTLQKHKRDCFIQSLCQLSQVEVASTVQSTSSTLKQCPMMSLASAKFAASAVVSGRETPKPSSQPKPNESTSRKSNNHTKRLKSEQKQNNVDNSLHTEKRTRYSKLKAPASATIVLENHDSSPGPLGRSSPNNPNSNPNPSRTSILRHKNQRQIETGKKAPLSGLCDGYMYQRKANLKGYQIPKKGSPPIYGATLPEINEVHDLVPISCTKTTTEVLSSIHDKVMQETSDYGSYSSSPYCDRSSTGGDETSDGDIGKTIPPPPSLSGDEKYDTITPEESDFQNCTIKHELENDPSPLPTKMEIIDGVEYVIIKNEGEEELEYADVFTEEDGVLFSMEQGVLFQVVEDFKNENDQLVDVTMKDDVIHYIEEEEDNNFQYKREETQEMLDLELGAVEIVESEESFGPEGVHDNELDAPLDEILLKDDNNYHCSLNQNLSEANSGRNMLDMEKNCSKVKDDTQRKPHSSPTNLLTSVLEKTLLIKLRRCDKELELALSNASRSKCRSTQRNIEDESEINVSTTFPISNPVMKSPRPPPRVSPILLSPPPPPLSPILSPPSVVTHQPKSLKRKHKQKREERWDVVQLEDLTDTTSHAPIKLKIKRRRFDEEVQDRLVKLPQGKTRAGNETKKSTNSPQFFSGLCKICGVKCKYEEAKTYHYKTSNNSKPFSCCTCSDIFSEEGWSVHDKICYTLEDVSIMEHCRVTFDQPMIKIRSFICSTCFNYMSKSKR